jgi:hypothetical protein
MSLVCSADASHACYEDETGHYGYDFSIGEENGMYYCKSQKLKTITLSSMESDYVTMSLAATEVLFFRQLLDNIGFSQYCANVIFQDNKSSTIYAEGGDNFHRTKHINVR